MQNERDFRKKRHGNYDGYHDFDINELRNLERNDDGFKDEDNSKNKKAGCSISPLGGSDAYFFSYEDPYPKFEEVVSLEFQNVGKIYWYFYPEGAQPETALKSGDTVVAYSERGIELAKVLNKSEAIFKRQDKINFIKNGIIRKANESDIQKDAELNEKAKESKKIVDKVNKELGISMKLIKVKYTLDDTKAIIYFTANGRVDFRELIKRLAFELRKRIEMRQIGVRDTTKMMGGLGPCGQTLCCGTFLHSFASVSIKMAKEQNLSLNPHKISGICGRLFCCLSYENDTYEDLRKDYPVEEQEIFDTVTNRSGFVKKINVIQKTISVDFIDPKNGRREEKFFTKDQIFMEENQYKLKEKPAINLDDVKPIVAAERDLFKKDRFIDDEDILSPDYDDKVDKMIESEAVLKRERDKKDVLDREKAAQLPKAIQEVVVKETPAGIQGQERKKFIPNQNKPPFQKKDNRNSDGDKKNPQHGKKKFNNKENNKEKYEKKYFNPRRDTVVSEESE